MDKNQAIEFKGLFGGVNIDDAIVYLTKAQLRDENIFINFNGHKIYSADVTIDGVYKEVLGMTREEYKEQERKWREEWEEQEHREKAEAQAKIPTWIEEGKKYIPESHWEEWEKCVNIRANDLYHGMELDNLLEVLQAIESGNAKTKEDVEGILNDQNHSGASYGMMKSMLKTFSEKYNNLPDENEK